MKARVCVHTIDQAAYLWPITEAAVAAAAEVLEQIDLILGSLSWCETSWSTACLVALTRPENLITMTVIPDT